MNTFMYLSKKLLKNGTFVRRNSFKAQDFLYCVLKKQFLCLVTKIHVNKQKVKNKK